MEGGEEELLGQVFGFLGDRTTGIIQPIPVGILDKLWKWVPRKVAFDSSPLELFYSTPANAKKLESTTGEQTAALPRFGLFPPELIEFCALEARTPFALHQKIIDLANKSTDDNNIMIENSHLIRDWCIAASHDDASSTVNSIMAVSFNPAPYIDPVFAQWAQMCLDKLMPMQGMTPGGTMQAQARPAAPPDGTTQAKD